MMCKTAFTKKKRLFNTKNYNQIILNVGRYLNIANVDMKVEENEQ